MQKQVQHTNNQVNDLIVAIRNKNESEYGHPSIQSYVKVEVGVYANRQNS